MERRKLQRWAAVVILAIMAVVALEGLGLFEAGHDDCADNHEHDACVCVCACHTFALPSGGIEVAPPTLASTLSTAPLPATGVPFSAEIFRPPLA